MTLLIAGTFLFFAAHTFSAFRSRAAGHDIRERMGEGSYMGLYSLVSLLGFALMLYGYSQVAKGSLLIASPGWGRGAAFLLMAVAFILLMSAYMPRGYIKSFVQHPMVLGVGVWAFAHLFTGVDLREAVLFGAFFAFCLVDYVASLRRPSPAGTRKLVGDLLAVSIGLVAYGVFLSWGHAYLLGVSPV
ncbi:MAG: NnrU family protein [Pseudomonadota bacterium]